MRFLLFLVLLYAPYKANTKNSSSGMPSLSLLFTVCHLLLSFSIDKVLLSVAQRNFGSSALSHSMLSDASRTNVICTFCWEWETSNQGGAVVLSGVKQGCVCVSFKYRAGHSRTPLKFRSTNGAH